jgi:hypothetical protein
MQLDTVVMTATGLRGPCLGHQVVRGLAGTDVRISAYWT